jgi:hypothetical protein
MDTRVDDLMTGLRREIGGLEMPDESWDRIVALLQHLPEQLKIARLRDEMESLDKAVNR